MSECPVCFEPTIDDTAHGCSVCRNRICSSCFFNLRKLICPLCRNAYHHSVKSHIAEPIPILHLSPSPIEMIEVIDVSNLPLLSPPLSPSRFRNRWRN